MATAQLTAPIMIDVHPTVANAIVQCVAWELTREGETLMDLPISDLPGDLAGIASHAHRIVRLADINDQLLWRAHHGGACVPVAERDTLLALCADEAVLLDVALSCRKWADEFARDDEAPQQGEALARASRAIAAAVAQADGIDEEG